uniref:Uncharacterized protein n=1 Tax=Arundo donax TaxID=35708 RepID=A0A0A8XX39_ARUDO
MFKTTNYNLQVLTHDCTGLKNCLLSETISRCSLSSFTKFDMTYDNYQQKKKSFRRISIEHFVALICFSLSPYSFKASFLPNTEVAQWSISMVDDVTTTPQVLMLQNSL